MEKEKNTVPVVVEACMIILLRRAQYWESLMGKCSPFYSVWD